MPRIVPMGYALPAGTVGMIRLMDMYVYVWVCSAAAGFWICGWVDITPPDAVIRIMGLPNSPRAGGPDSVCPGQANMALPDP